jgi:hypothetical protein
MTPAQRSSDAHRDFGARRLVHLHVSLQLLQRGRLDRRAPISHAQPARHTPAPGPLLPHRRPATTWAGAGAQPACSSRNCRRESSAPRLAWLARGGGALGEEVNDGVRVLGHVDQGDDDGVRRDVLQPQLPRDRLRGLQHRFCGRAERRVLRLRAPAGCRSRGKQACARRARHQLAPLARGLGAGARTAWPVARCARSMRRPFSRSSLEELRSRLSAWQRPSSRCSSLTCAGTGPLSASGASAAWAAGAWAAAGASAVSGAGAVSSCAAFKKPLPAPTSSAPAALASDCDSIMALIAGSVKRSNMALITRWQRARRGRRWLACSSTERFCQGTARRPGASGQRRLPARALHRCGARPVGTATGPPTHPTP